MASRFVSAGTLEKPTERDSEWLQAQQEIEDTHRRKAQDEKRQQDGRSLYEVLQQNKLAKQEAFEESIKLKNQFRALNDEEVDFLETTVQAERAKEDALKKTTGEQLERFRQRQQRADQGIDEDLDADASKAEVQADSEENLNWSAHAKKRKRVKEKEGFRGVKVRRTSSANEQKSELENPVPETPSEILEDPVGFEKTEFRNGGPARSNKTTAGKTELPDELQRKKTATPVTKTTLPLVGYGSDEDSD